MVATTGSRLPRRTSRGTNPRKKVLFGAGAFTVAVAVAITSFLTAIPAQAAPVSVARGSFLTGSALGINLAGLLAVTDAQASNTGATASVTQVRPLLAADLNTGATVSLGNGVNLLGTNGILTLGAVNQYAQAKSDGSSTAASGAVTDAGAIGVPGQNGVPPANASVNLGPLITGGLTAALSEANLTVGALSATAAQQPGANGAQTGDYRIAGLQLGLTSPLVGGVRTGLVNTVSALQPTVNALPNLIHAVLPFATITGVPNVGAVVGNALGNITSADGSITANLQTGAVSIDVAKVLTSAGLDLNDLDPNTDLLPYITAALTSQLLPAIVGAVNNAITAVTNSITGITVTVAGIPVALSILNPILTPVINGVVAPLLAVIPTLASTVIAPLSTALSTLITLRVNVQSTTGGIFTERALQVGLLPNAPTPVALLNLASASVGPNAGPIPTATSMTPTRGPVAGGTPVTITGSNFTAGTTVSVDGGPAITPTSIAVNGQSLVFVTPPHAAGNVGVTVTNASGTSAPLTFTYDPIPTTTGLTPNHGPIAGGTAVTITGTGFTAQSRVSVDGGAPIVPTSVAPNGLSLVFSTPAHATGPVPVTVTTQGGVSNAQTYTYDPLPTLTSLTPVEGPVAGGTTVTVNGTGFTAGSTVSVDGGPAITPATINGAGTSLTFVTPSHAAATVPVTVTTTAGTTTAGQFTFVPAPTTTSLDPTNGPTAGGTSVTITGTGFTAGSTVSVDGGAPIAPTSVAPNGLSLVFDTPAHVQGPVPVSVTTVGGTSAPQTFTYNPPVPTAISLAPNTGPTIGGTSVTISGTGFVTGSTVTVDGVEIIPDSIAPNGQSLVFTTLPHAAGAVDVTVTTPGGTSTPALTFTYGVPPLGTPTATNLDPTSGPAAGGTPVTIFGANFGPGSTVSVDGEVIIPDSIATDGLSLVFTTPTHQAGPVPVTVTTSVGTTAPLEFTYIAAAPTATGLAPDHGPIDGGTLVTISGTDFIPGSTVSIDDGAPITPTSIAANGRSLTFITPAHVEGPVNVTVTTTSGTTGPLVFTFAPDPIPAPTADELDPDHGPTAGGTIVTITGTDFVPGSVVSIDGGPAITPTNIAADGESLTFVTPVHAAGTVQVTVTTPSGTSAPLDFVYDPLPTSLSLVPNHGPFSGGTSVTITGTGFTPGSIVRIDGGAAITPTNIATDGLSLTFSTPAHAPGPVAVRVTTDAGTTGPLAFTYDAAPTATSLDPDHGPAAGETSVTVAGTGFTAGTTVSVDGSAPIVPDSIASDGLSLTFTTPPHTAGDVPVVVTSPAGSAAALTYTYDAAPVPAPTITALAPDFGPAAGGTTVTISGTNFTPDSIVTIAGNDVTPATVAPNGNSLTFVTPPGTAGPAIVTVTTPNGQSGELTFTYGAPPALAPTATGIDPTSGPTAGNTLVTITGTNFTASSTVSVDGSQPITPDSVDPDGTELTFRTPAHPAGPVPVTVTTSAGTTAAQTFTFVAPPVPAPTTSGIAPNHGPEAGGTQVTITGTGFTAASTVSVDGSAPIAPDSIADNGRSLVFTTPVHADGTVPVSVTTAAGTSGSQFFTYDPAPVPAPTAIALAPDNGPIAGGTVVTITGTNFSPGSTVSIDGGGPITPTSIAPNGQSLTFTTPAHAAGEVEVTVTSPTGTTDPLVFTYGAPPALAPTATDLDPDNGPAAGGTPVTITGTNFDEDSTVSIDGVTVIPTDVDPLGTSLTFVTPPHAAGDVPVTVTTAVGTTAALTFTYDPAPPVQPTATGISPDSGPTAGGTPVTITGTGFITGSTVSIDGGPAITPTSIATNGRSLTFTTPAHGAGAVEVTVTTAGGETDPLDFTFVAPPVHAPTATSLDPNHGPSTGGTPVEITGTNFTATSTVSINGGPAITPVSVEPDGLSLVFTTPPRAAGDVTITVTTPTGTSAGLIYTYDAVVSPAPTAIALDPTHGPAAGGTVVTISGTNFTLDSLISIDGGTPFAPDSIAGDGSSVTFETDPHAAGDVILTVTTPDGTSNGLTYRFDAAPVGPPTATSLNPEVGPAAGGTTVTITGTNFTVDAVVLIDGGSPIAPASVSPDGTTLTFVTPPHAAGDVTITVSTTAGDSGDLDFEFQAAPPAAPTASDLDPESGPAAGGTPVTITGTGFTTGSIVNVDGEQVSPTSVDSDGESLTFTTPEHDAGPVPVSVTTAGGTTAALTFTYIAAPVPAPTITSLAPNTGAVEGGLAVTITGTNFSDGSVVNFDGEEIIPDSIAPNGNSLVFTTPPHALGAVDVSVTSPTGTTAELTFTYVEDAIDAPTAASIVPDHGPVAGGNTVTINGTNFTDDATVSVDGGDPITPLSIAPDGLSLTFEAPAHAFGPVPVSVTTADGTSGALTYTYDAAPVPAPTVNGIAPNHGPIAGGTLVTITGTNFTLGTTVSVDGGPELTPASIAPNGNSLTFNTPAHAAGDVSVVVTTPTGSTDEEDLTFTYDAAPIPLPVVTGITPANGPIAGGTTVTITGTGFVTGTTVSVDGGPAITPATTNGAGTSLTFVTPPHAAGDVSVTVTNPTGTSDPDDATFTYDPLLVPGPTVAGLTPDTGSVDGGLVVTITGTGFVAGTTVSVDGGPAIVPTSIASDGTSLTFVTPPHAVGDVSVVVTTPNGSTDPDDLTFTYDDGDTANPLPAPVILTPADDETVTTDRPVFTGTGDPGNEIVLTDDGEVICETTVASNGTWTCTPEAPLDDGTHTIVVTETEPGGQTGTDTVTFEVAADDNSGPGDGDGDGDGDDNGGGNDDDLAATGLDIAAPLLSSVLLLGAGAGVLLWMRRRRSGSDWAQED